MNERGKHMRHRIEALLRALRDEAARKWELNRREGREAERAGRRDRADVDVLEEVLESD